MIHLASGSSARGEHALLIRELGATPKLASSYFLSHQFRNGVSA
jgi:hypothetical protein